ncbi:transposase family protein [Pseudomonas sp. MAFF212428]|uniref:Transposase family protein n=1 Tax=Pseudomonas brassicae TaxID=2708063 RepID=A0A6B3NUN0_9PSED|nr:Mu transposase C-terminal domain-containing protein [Pseudomonas brassicae]NER59981.1 transposase family protein [Pseudomonas brassicae]NER63970.1 transposase family protein [Pseudomonas brassicae]
MSRALAVDSIILERDQVRRVVSIRPEISQIVLQGSLGEEFVLRIDDFQQRFAQGQYRRSYGPTVSAVQPMPVRNLTQTERGGLDQRLELLEYIKEARRDGCSWTATIERLQAHCVEQNLPLPSIRTIQRWRKSSTLAGSTDQLAPRFSARGNKRRMQTPDDLDFEETVVDEIMRSYFHTDKFNVTQITKLVNDQCRARAAQRNTRFRGISRRSVSRRIRELEQTLIAPGRVSKATLDQEMRAAIRKLLVERPYERVEVDATPLDIFCCDVHGKLIGRANCYVGIDVASGGVVMVKCCIAKPSQDFVLSALEFCFSPKGEAFSERYGLNHPWLVPAAIETMVLDNAQEHHGGLVLNALRYLNTTIDYPMAGKPQAKPFIERFFGTLKSGLINTLPGSTKSQSKFERDPLGRAMKERLYTVQELEALIIKWVADVYMQTPSQRLEYRFEPGCSPARAMELLKQRYVLIPPPDPEEFRNACLRYNVDELTLSREGVCYQTMTYNSLELSKLYQRRGQKTKVKVRFNPLDCRSVFVVDPSDAGVLIEAHNRLTSMPLISFEEARKIRRALRKSDAELSGENYQIEHMQMLRGIRERAAGGRMKDQNRAARSLEREEKRLEAQRQEPPRPVVEAITETPSSVATLTAAPRRKKSGQGDAE